MTTTYTVFTTLFNMKFTVPFMAFAGLAAAQACSKNKTPRQSPYMVMDRITNQMFNTR